MQAAQKFINRDAVAAVLGHVDVGLLPQPVTVLDIRRNDERALYGSIPGKKVALHFKQVSSCMVVTATLAVAALELPNTLHYLAFLGQSD